MLVRIRLPRDSALSTASVVKGRAPPLDQARPRRIASKIMGLSDLAQLPSMRHLDADVLTPRSIGETLAAPTGEAKPRSFRHPRRREEGYVKTVGVASLVGFAAVLSAPVLVATVRAAGLAEAGRARMRAAGIVGSGLIDALAAKDKARVVIAFSVPGAARVHGDSQRFTTFAARAALDAMSAAVIGAFAAGEFGNGCCPDGNTTQSGAGAAEDDNGHGTNVAGTSCNWPRWLSTPKSPRRGAEAAWDFS